MFDLELAIANWRAGMKKAGVRPDEILDELESHLRDDIDARMKPDTTLEEAFNQSAAKIGSGQLLGPAFGKKCWQISAAMGVVGLVMTLALNFAGHYVFHRPSSVIGSADWRSAWLPGYLVWLTFALVALGKRFRPVRG